MKILITGSSGFLGSHLSAFLKNSEHEITLLNSKNCDLRNSNNLINYSNEKFDFLFHLAAWTQAGDFCITHPGEQWIINQQINTNFLAWWASHQPQAKLVFMGTSCAYATDSNLIESEYMQGEPIDSLYTYAMTKRMLYQGARALSQQYNIRYLCTVPSTLYGPGYHNDGRQMHFIFDLIRKIVRGKKFGEPVILWGDGYQKRELVLVGDFVKILWDLAMKFDNEIFNIGAGKEYSIRDFAKIICNYVDYPLEKIQYDTDRYVGAKSKCLNVEKINMHHSNYSLEDIESGIQKTILWFYESKAYERISM
jgi:GDP-L-fucose synthase